MTRFYAGQLDYIPQLNAMDATIAGTTVATSAVAPQPLGTAAAGASSSVSRGDHVHASTGTTQTLDDNSLQYATTGFVQQIVSTTLVKSVVGGVTLTAIEAACPIIDMTGVLTANVSVIVPASSREWLVLNNTTGSFTATVKTSAGTGVAIVQGTNKALYCDGVNILATNTDLSGLSLSGLSLTGTTGGTINGALTTTLDLSVGGNLIVNGTTTSVNSTTVTVKDPVITLGGSTAPASSDSKDRGVEYHYYNGSAKVGFFGYKDSTGKFTFIPDATNTSEVFTGATGTLTANIDGTAANVSGIVAIANGGTGATTAPLALSNLGAAPLASPALTGTPTAPTASATDNSTTLATTGFVQALRDITGGFVSMTLYKINFKNALNTFTSFFTNSNTAPRIYTFQDRDGTIADNTDLALKANSANPTFTGTVSGVTSTMVGLGNVNNTSDASKPTSTATTSALALKADLASPTFTGTVSGVTATMVGLGSVNNTSDTAKPVSTAQATAIALKADLASPTFTGTVSGITKSMVGLSNVDNISDANKPLSTADVAALALKADIASQTFTGTPTLPTGTIGVTQIAGTSATSLATTAFVTTADNLKANIASPTFTGTVGGITSAMVGLGSVTNTSDASKPVSTAQATAIALKADLASPTFTGTVSGITSTMVGLGNVNNTSDASKLVSTAQATAIALKADIASQTFTGTPTLPTGTIAVTQIAGDSTTALATTAFVTAANSLKANLASPTFTGTVSGVTSTMVGLGSVNNTSDASKPVSTAQATAIALKADIASQTFTGTPTLPTGTIGVTQVAGTSTTTLATTAFATTADNLKANTASPTFTGTVSGITATMVGAPAGSGTSTGANTGDQTLPVASSTTPAALGTAAVGTGTTFARADHVHLQPTLATLGAQASGTYASGTGSASGTNTGDQTNITGNAATVTTNATTTGDVTSVGNATTIAANVVSLAKMATITTASLLGRSTAATGNVEVLSATTAKTLLALDLVNNTSDANKPVSTAQATAIALKADAASPTFTGTVSGITSAMVALGNVNNTSDINKPVSTAQAAATAALVANLAASSGSGMVGHLPAGSGAVIRTVQSKLRESVSVKDFGAVGDGVTDDTVAIQAAVSAADKVLFPKASYNISTSISLHSNSEIDLGGSIINWVGGVVNNANKASKWNLAVFYSNLTIAPPSTIKYNVGIRNGTINVNDWGCGVAFKQTENFYIQDLIVKNAVVGGICVADCAQGSIDRCTLLDCAANPASGFDPVLDLELWSDGMAVWYGSQNVSVNDCLIKNTRVATGRCGIFFEGTSTESGRVTSYCSMNNCTVSGYDRQFHVELSNNISAYNCGFETVAAGFKTFSSSVIVWNTVNTTFVGCRLLSKKIIVSHFGGLRTTFIDCKIESTNDAAGTEAFRVISNLFSTLNFTNCLINLRLADMAMHTCEAAFVGCRFTRDTVGLGNVYGGAFSFSDCRFDRVGIRTALGVTTDTYDYVNCTWVNLGATDLAIASPTGILKNTLLNCKLNGAQIYSDSPLQIIGENSPALNVVGAGISASAGWYANGVKLNNGNVVLTSGKGIDFSDSPQGSGTLGNKLLHDYEEGTWLPSVGGTPTYVKQYGKYTKIGRVVHVTFTLQLDVATGASGTTITGLPFVSAISSSYSQSGSLAFFDNLSTAVTSIAPVVNQGTSAIIFRGTVAAQSTVSYLSVISTYTYMMGSLTYMID